MITELNTKINLEHGEWKPETPIILPPLFVWPPRPLVLLKYFFGYPGYLLPWNLGYMTLAIVTWFFFDPRFFSYGIIRSRVDRYHLP